MLQDHVKGNLARARPESPHSAATGRVAVLARSFLCLLQQELPRLQGYSAHGIEDWPGRGFSGLHYGPTVGHSTAPLPCRLGPHRSLRALPHVADLPALQTAAGQLVANALGVIRADDQNQPYTHVEYAVHLSLLHLAESL